MEDKEKKDTALVIAKNPSDRVLSGEAYTRAELRRVGILVRVRMEMKHEVSGVYVAYHDRQCCYNPGPLECVPEKIE